MFQQSLEMIVTRFSVKWIYILEMCQALDAHRINAKRTFKLTNLALLTIRRSAIELKGERREIS